LPHVRFTPDEFLARLPGPTRERSVPVYQHGTLVVKVYAPRGSDPQQPHTRDEIYVVISGSGTFVRGGERVSFTPHDLLFAPAGVPHRFENFTDDFAVWLMFYGPEGGEAQ
jgi:mannose-6-phosphate isomerase-like protein (cupin superfamily)